MSLLVQKKLVLELTVNVGLERDEDVVSDSSLQTALVCLLNDSCDGRQPFGVETLKRGLEEVVESSVWQAVCADAAKYERMVPTGEGSSTNVSHLLAEAKMRKVSYVRVGSEILVRELSTKGPEDGR